MIEQTGTITFVNNETMDVTKYRILGVPGDPNSLGDVENASEIRSQMESVDIMGGFVSHHLPSGGSTKIDSEADVTLDIVATHTDPETGVKSIIEHHLLEWVFVTGLAGSSFSKPMEDVGMLLFTNSLVWYDLYVRPVGGELGGGLKWEDVVIRQDWGVLKNAQHLELPVELGEGVHFVAPGLGCEFGSVVPIHDDSIGFVIEYH